MRGAIPPLPQYALMAWCSVKAQGLLLPSGSGYVQSSSERWKDAYPDGFVSKSYFHHWIPSPQFHVVRFSSVPERKPGLGSLCRVRCLTQVSSDLE
jgi:hypothetical protein